MQGYSQSKNQLIQALRADVETRQLKADQVIAKLFEHAQIIPVTAAIIERAKVRFDRGNLPGKANSYGDAIHWECLLEAVPNGEELSLISEDQDYRSQLDDARPRSFLVREWKDNKGANLHLFRRLSLFLAQHAQHAEALANEERDAAIRSLRASSNFVTTHAIVDELQSFPHFTNEQAAAIVEACLKNPQVSWIIGDADVEAFMQRILNDYGPHLPQVDREALDGLLAATQH